MADTPSKEQVILDILTTVEPVIGHVIEGIQLIRNLTQTPEVTNDQIIAAQAKWDALSAKINRLAKG